MIRFKLNTLNKLLFLLIVFLVIACTTVPLTNRKQLKFIPEAELLSMSFQQFNEVKKTSKLSTDKADLAMVNKIGLYVSKSADEFIREKGLGLSMNWEFILIEDDEVVNAWCMPGGKVAVYTGILQYTKTEGGLAAVIGHEIAHALAQHGNERLSQGLLVQLGGLTLSKAMATSPEATRELWLKAYGIGANLGFILPYSRTQEYEADYIGLILMAKAGFNPQEAIDFWERMRKSGGEKPPEFLSTHPADEKRIAAMKKHLPEAISSYRARR